MKDKLTAAPAARGSNTAWYIMAMIGSAVYFVQRVDGFWPIVLALLKALVWPAFLIFDLFKYLTYH